MRKLIESERILAAKEILQQQELREFHSLIKKQAEYLNLLK
jgi:hypothetical protein